MDVVREEVFGPAAPITIADSKEDAIREANNTEYGLGASIWTDNLEEGINLARKVQSGVVTVNEIVKSDPRMPFGGINKLWIRKGAIPLRNKRLRQHKICDGKRDKKE